MTPKMLHHVFVLLASVVVVSSFLPQQAVQLMNQERFSIRRPAVEDSDDGVEAAVLAETRLQLLRQWGLDKRYGDKSGRNEAAKELLTLAKASPAAIYLEDENDEIAVVGESPDDDDDTYGNEATNYGDSYRSSTTSTIPRVEIPAEGLSKRERKKMAAERRKQTAAVFVAADPNAEAYLSSDPARRHLKAKNSNDDSTSGSGSKLLTEDALAAFELDLRELLGPSRPPRSSLLQLEAWLTDGLPETTTGASLATAQHTAVLLALAVEFELRAISTDSQNSRASESSTDRGSSSSSSQSGDLANALVRMGTLHAHLDASCAATATTTAADAEAPVAVVPAVVRASQVNQLVRWFGRANAPRAALSALRLLDCTSTYGSSDPSSSSSSSSKKLAQFAVPLPNAESYEFLANAFVKDVVLEGAANSMARLPPPIPKETPVLPVAAAAAKGGKAAPVPRSAPLQEVLFVGRSNAGKSSLVNMLVGRKALASTSSDPGHTQSFFFYRVNKDRGNKNNIDGAGSASEGDAPPEFRLVDVPGVGYTSEASGADHGDRASWRSLLERYMLVRAGLTMVFHLVDSKAGLQPADYDLLRLAATALTSRSSGSSSSSSSNDNGADSDESDGTSTTRDGGTLGNVQYVLVLTKADKATPLETEAQAREVRKSAAREFAAAAATAAAAQAANDEEGDAGKRVESLAVPQVIVTSAKARPPIGRDRMWECLVEALLNERGPSATEK